MFRKKSQLLLISNLKNNFPLFFLLFSCLYQNTQAGEVFTTETVFAENRSPVIQLYSLSRPDYTVFKKHNTSFFKSRVELINYLSSNRKTGEFFAIDGETWLVSNAFQHQVTNNIILHLNVHWLRHSKGKADHFIYAFHDLFQLPQNGRSDKFHDRISWNLSTDKDQVILLNEQKSGIGDIQAKLSWAPEKLRNTQITALLKLPTGNFEDQTGSENVDFGLSLALSNPKWLKNRDWLSAFPLSLWYGAGINYLGTVKELDDFNAYPLVATLRTGVAWAITLRWNVKAQFDSNTPLFDANIRELGWMPAQISLASEHLLSDKVTLDFIINEDLRPRASPDIIFSTGLSIQF